MSNIPPNKEIDHRQKERSVSAPFPGELRGRAVSPQEDNSVSCPTPKPSSPPLSPSIEGHDVLSVPRTPPPERSLSPNTEIILREKRFFPIRKETPSPASDLSSQSPVDTLSTTSSSPISDIVSPSPIRSLSPQNRLLIQERFLMWFPNDDLHTYPPSHWETSISLPLPPPPLDEGAPSLCFIDEPLYCEWVEACIEEAMKGSEEPPNFQERLLEKLTEALDGGPSFLDYLENPPEEISTLPPFLNDAIGMFYIDSWSLFFPDDIAAEERLFALLETHFPGEELANLSQKFTFPSKSAFLREVERSGSSFLAPREWIPQALEEDDIFLPVLRPSTPHPEEENAPEYAAITPDILLRFLEKCYLHAGLRDNSQVSVDDEIRDLTRSPALRRYIQENNNSRPPSTGPLRFVYRSPTGDLFGADSLSSRAEAL